jgi:peptidoglycan/LPS O-acetylase OafA/YrhL
MENRKPIYGLDIVRFCSALLVVAWHNLYRFFDPDAEHINVFVAGIPPTGHELQSIGVYGWVGVQVFFVISGIVISFSAQQSTASKFFVARIGRIWPGVIICTALILIINLGYWQFDAWSMTKQAIKSLVIWPLGGWIAPQFWTLPVELIFYALIFLMIYKNALHRMHVFAFMLIGISALYWLLVYYKIISPNFKTDSLILLQHGMYFGLGICISLIASEGLNLQKFVAGAVALLTAAMEIDHSIARYGVETLSPVQWLSPFGIWFGSLAAISLSLIFRTQIAGVVERLRLDPVLRSLGLATYPLYLIHIHVGGLVTSIMIGQGITVVPAVLIGIFSCIPISAFLAVKLEPPLRRQVERTILRAQAIKPIGTAAIRS